MRRVASITSAEIEMAYGGRPETRLKKLSLSAKYGAYCHSVVTVLLS